MNCPADQGKTTSNYLESTHLLNNPSSIRSLVYSQMVQQQQGEKWEMHGPKQPLITHLTFSLTKAHNGNFLNWFTAAVITRVGPIRHHYTLKKIKRQKHFTTQGSIAKKKLKCA